MKVEDIKKALPKKGISKTAKKAGVSISLASMVLDGKRNNDRVLYAALEVIEEEKKRRIDLLRQLKKATSI